MTSTPPVPEDNQSPYPIDTPAEEGQVRPQQGEALAAAKEAAEARKRRGVSNTTLGVGAAIGIGSAALVAALLYARSGRKDDKS